MTFSTTPPRASVLNENEAGRLCDSAASAMIHGSNQLGSVPGIIRRIIEECAWKRRKVALHGIVELPSLRDLITLPPMKGWGEDPAKVEALLRDDIEVLAMWREEMTGEHGGDRRSEKAETKSDNITLETDRRGTSRSYTVSRLQKQRPDLFADVKAGKLSANAAAIKAGFRKVKPPLELAIRAFRKLNDRDRQEFERRKDGIPSKLDPGEVTKARFGPRELKDPRSRAYAIQTLYALKRYAENAKFSQELVAKELDEIDQYRHWEILGYSSREDMLRAESVAINREVA